MTEEKYNQSQTQFSLEEPLLERPVQQETELDEASKPAKSRPKWLWWVAGLLAVLLVLIIVLALTSKQNPPAETELTTPPSAVRQLSPLEQRLEIARKLLRQANPTTQELSFPPINTTLRIDKAR